MILAKTQKIPSLLPKTHPSRAKPLVDRVSGIQTNDASNDQFRSRLHVLKHPQIQ